MTIKTAPATADVPAPALTDLLWSTDPNLHRYMFGTKATLQRVLEREWPSDRGLLSHTHAFCAQFGADPVGFLIGHTEQDYAENFDFSVTHQTTALEPDEAAHLRSALHWMDRLFPTPRPDSYYILEFAVSPLAQGEGVATQLFELAEARARAQECAQICLDVAAQNDAVGFYRHLGFQAEVETRLPSLDEGFGIGCHLHMVRDIPP